MDGDRVHLWARHSDCSAALTRIRDAVAALVRRTWCFAPGASFC
jgi:hypothetical protein